MATLDEIFDLELFNQMRDETYIRTQISDDGELEIVNYTEKAQFARMWNEVTLNCRGLIYNITTREVIARGYKKFFNWDDSSQQYPPTGPVLRSPKMDGSLGILYFHNGRWAIATRGSFNSDQAIHASAKVWPSWEMSLLAEEGITYLFEIIYPENRIVVNYGDDDRLVLLDAIDTATGKANISAFDAFPWADKVAKVPLPGFQDTMASDIPTGEEGFVFYWPEKDFRVKMKAAEYIELHRMIFGLNARSVWSRLGDGETVKQIAERLPDEFHQWVRDIALGLFVEASSITQRAKNQFIDVESRLPPDYTRKEFAVEAVKSSMKAYLFMLVDGKDIKDVVWQAIKPAGGITISTISEDVA